jgi:hypothetical protein
MRLAASSALFALVSLADPASAQTHDAATAQSLFLGAKASEKAGDYRKACAQFAESQRLDPAPGTLLNEADCEEHLGAVASAWTHYVAARDQLARTDDRWPFANGRIAALEKRVPHLVLRLASGAPPGTRVVRDATEVGAAAFGVPLALDPGPHTITVAAPGHSDAVTQVSVAEGESKDVALELGPAHETAMPTLVATPHSQAADAGRASPVGPGSSDSRSTLGWAVGGVGLAGLIVGALAGVVAMGDAGTVKSDCASNGACRTQAGVDAGSEGKTFSVLSTAGFIGGAALMGVGVYLVLSSGSSAAPQTVGATALPGGAALSYSWRLSL